MCLCLCHRAETSFGLRDATTSKPRKLMAKPFVDHLRGLCVDGRVRMSTYKMLPADGTLLP